MRGLLFLAIATTALADQPVAKKPLAPAAPVASAQFTKLAKEADTAREANRLDEATDLYQKALKLRPGWPEGWWYLGTILYDKDRYTEARDALRHVVALKPKMPPGWALLGLCEYEIKQYEPAGAHLDHARILGLSPDDPLSKVARYHLGLLLTKYEKFDAALDVLLQAARLNEDPTQDLIMALGLAALRKPVLPQELQKPDFEAARLAGQATFDAANRRGPQAQVSFDELVTKYPAMPNVHFLYGSFLLFGDRDAGMRELTKELEISPNSVPTLVQITSEYLKAGEPEKALPFAERATRIDPESFIALSFKGRVKVETGKLEEGILDLEKAEKMAPGSPQIRIYLASAYQKAGRKDEAAKERAEFQRLKGLVKKPGDQ